MTPVRYGRREDRSRRVATLRPDATRPAGGERVARIARRYGATVAR